MIVFPNAKINLGLYVTGERADGYHNIESVLYPVGLCDILEVIPSGPVTTFHVTGRAIPGKKEDNIVWKAYELIRSEHDIPPVRIGLHKVIPSGAGLGGGSSDAAFMLRLLKDLFGLPLKMPDLLRLAARLGSDCPFFIRNIPSKAAGRGELLTPCDPFLEGYFGMIYMPEVQISTAGAYKSAPVRFPPENFIHIERTPVHSWKDWLANSFEDHTVSLHPEIARIRERLYEAGAVYASMTGSGSAVYGVFANEPDELPVIPEGELVWKGMM